MVRYVHGRPFVKLSNRRLASSSGCPGFNVTTVGARRPIRERGVGLRRSGMEYISRWFLFSDQGGMPPLHQTQITERNAVFIRTARNIRFGRRLATVSLFSPRRQGFSRVIEFRETGALRQRNQTEALHFEEASGARFDIRTRCVSTVWNGPK